MSTTAQLGGERGTFAGARHYYCRAAEYDMAYARYADTLDGREQITRHTVTAITAVTSLSLFGSLFVDNPAFWARVVVFFLAATTSTLMALRQDARWLKRSLKMRAQGVEWARQRGKAEDLVCRIMNGEDVAEQEVAALRDSDAALLRSNPALSHRLIEDCRKEVTKEFDEGFKLEV